MADVTLRPKSARELARFIRERAVSPVEVLDAHLATVAEINPILNAIVTLAAEQALDAVRRSERAVATGEPARLSRRRSTRNIQAGAGPTVLVTVTSAALILYAAIGAH
jgi:hypothetical protein